MSVNKKVTVPEGRGPPIAPQYRANGGCAVVGFSRAATP